MAPQSDSILFDSVRFRSIPFNFVQSPLIPPDWFLAVGVLWEACFDDISIVFLAVLFRHQFLVDPGLFVSLWGLFRALERNKNSRMGSPGPRFWVFGGPRFANPENLIFAAMRSVS